MPKRILAAFDQGQVPTICCLNLATTPLGVDFAALVAALQEYANKHFAPVWATPCQLVAGQGRQIPAGQWGLVFLDDADQANALGYHYLTPGGLPLSKIFVRTTLGAREQVSVTASHELAEMLVDPGVQLGALGPSNVWYAYETADAVEATSFNVAGIPMSNFVYPSWFEGFRRSGKFDHLGLCKRPFQILRGGYMPVFARGRWTQIFGSAAAKKQYGKTHHPRAESRKQQTAG
jgi:hypothetical protein